MEDLLSIIMTDKQITMPELAERLDTSQEMILARLERYEQLGYVKRISGQKGGSCSGHCGGCKGCGSHKTQMQPVVYWVKGDKANE